MRTDFRIIYFPFKGQEIREEEIGKFLECQICERNYCQFMDCFNLLNGYIFCKRTSYTSQAQITKHLTTSQENVSASTLLSTHSTAEELLISTSTSNKIISCRRKNCGYILCKNYIS